LDNVDCNSVLEQLSEFIDSDARDELCRQIKAHMSRCEDCRIKVDTVRKTIILYQESGPSTDVPMHATAQLTAALDREYAAAKRSRPAD
jgi:predicted anti-sigma-YlaC factor YlaD